MVSPATEANVAINIPLIFKCFLKGKVLFYSEIITSPFLLLTFIGYYLNPPLGFRTVCFRTVYSLPVIFQNRRNHTYFMFSVA